MRQTIHVVSKRDFWPLAVAVRASQREWLLRVRKPRPDERELERTAGELRAALADGPRRYESSDELTERRWGMSRTVAGARARAAVRDVGAAARAPVRDGRGVGWSRDGDARRRRSTTSSAATSARSARLRPETSRAGRARTCATSRPRSSGSQLRRFRDEAGNELVDLPRAPLPDPETPAPVRFLPTWDATLLVHARRSGILPEKYRSLVFDVKRPHSVGTFLVDGSVAGTWRSRACVSLHAAGRVVRLERATARELRGSVTDGEARLRRRESHLQLTPAKEMTLNGNRHRWTAILNGRSQGQRRRRHRRARRTSRARSSASRSRSTARTS